MISWSLISTWSWSPWFRKIKKTWSPDLHFFFKSRNPDLQILISWSRPDLERINGQLFSPMNKGRKSSNLMKSIREKIILEQYKNLATYQIRIRSRSGNQDLKIRISWFEKKSRSGDQVFLIFLNQGDQDQVEIRKSNLPIFEQSIFYSHETYSSLMFRGYLPIQNKMTIK